MVPEYTPASNNEIKGNPGKFILKNPLSLADAIKVAVVNNPDSAMASARIIQAEAMIEMSKSSFWPNIGFYTEYLQGDTPSASLFKTIDQRKFQANDFNNPGWFNNFESADKNHGQHRRNKNTGTN